MFMKKKMKEKEKNKKDKEKQTQQEEDEQQRGLTNSQKRLVELCSTRGEEADIARLEALLREEENALDPNFCFGPAATTPLWAASYWGNAAMVQMLLPRMATGSCDLPNQSGITPLMVASNRGHKDVVTCLLAGGAAVNATTGAGNSALHLACSRGRREVVSTLLEAGAKPFRNNFGQTPLDIADACGYKCAFMHTFEEVTPKRKEEVEFLSHHYGLVNECGAKTPSLKRVYKLLRKATPNFWTSSGTTPLSFATTSGSLSVVKALLQYHADVFAMDTDGKTALLKAIDKRHIDIALLLLEHGSDVHVQFRQESALIRATYHGCHALLNQLLARGADPNGCNVYGWPPLAFAMNSDYADAFKILLEGGADPFFRYQSNYESVWEMANANPQKYQHYIALMEPYCTGHEWQNDKEKEEHKAKLKEVG
ncbi:Ankyrin repeat [Balamuthia mandrillaris]